MNEYKHYGAYGLIIKNNKILLIKKVTGPYDGKLDLPGGSIEFGERPIEALKREILEEVGIKVTECQLFDADSVSFKWEYENTLRNMHHIGIFFKVLNYIGDVKKEIDIDNINDDSLGAEWYHISELKRDELSYITIMELQKLGYNII